MNTVKQSNSLAKSMVSGNKYRYLYGGKGELYTTKLVDTLIKKYPSAFSSTAADAYADADKGFRAGDCGWAVSTFLGISYLSSSQFKANAYKVYQVSKQNAKPGMVLYKSGHVAYVGEDLNIYEARSTKKDWTVSSWSSRASGFTSLLVVKGTALADEMEKESTAQSAGSEILLTPSAPIPASSKDKKYSKKYTLTASGSIRLGPSKQYASLATIKTGASVTCYGYYTLNKDNEIWLSVIYSGTTGFVQLSILK